MARRNYLARKARGTAPGYHRNKRLKSKYGLSPEDFDQMLEEQGGVCAICGTKEFGRSGPNATEWAGPAVDHDHTTGNVRGLLCRHCNVMLGAARDEPARLEAGIAYLLSHSREG